MVAGTDAVFTVTITGTAPSFQWQSSIDGLEWFDIAGAVDSTLRLTGWSQQPTTANASG